MYTLEIDSEETKHETLEEVANEVFDYVDFDREHPFDSIRDAFKVDGASTIDKMRIHCLVLSLIQEIQEEARQWNEHIKMERME